MTKTYCDCCGELMTDRNTPFQGQNGRRLQATARNSSARLTVEVITSTKGVANSGDVCKYCVLDALYDLDDRPRISPAPTVSASTPA